MPVRKYSKSTSNIEPLRSMKYLPESSRMEGIWELTRDERKLDPLETSVASVVSNLRPPTLSFTSRSC